MVTIRKRSKGAKEYHYLEHTIRVGDTVEKRERYLGAAIPKDIERVKREFFYEIFHERHLPMLQRIERGYAKDAKDSPASVRDEELRKFSTHFTYDTQRIEGSTLSLRETADLLERGITPSQRPTRDVKEAEAHQRIMQDLIATRKDVGYQLALHWYKMLFQDTRPEIAGQLRKHQVAISGSKFLPPSPVEVYPLLQEFFDWYAGNKRKTQPVELAALVHLKFVTIHPFADGNGRLSRLLMNLTLHRSRYPMVIIHYEGRNAYYRALERSQTTGQEHIFVQWFVKNYIKEHKRYMGS